MEIIEGNKLAKLCDYNFGDHHVVWDTNLTGEFEVANASNAKFLAKVKQFEGKVMSLFIDNIRLYNRTLDFKGPYSQSDAEFIAYLIQYNDLLRLCAQLSQNKFVIFTSHEDTPITDPIEIPENVLGIYGVNALSTDFKVHAFPIGLQRQIGYNDNRLKIMKELVEKDEKVVPSKLLYINCGIERNPERLPLAKFEANEWCTTRFDKDSKFFPYDRYNEFLSELRDHKFVACPIGHGMDTHRVWETLYMRRVPVVKDDYMYNLIKSIGMQAIKIDSWDVLNKEVLNQLDLVYQDAQKDDLSKLDLNTLYNNTMKQYGI